MTFLAAFGESFTDSFLGINAANASTDAARMQIDAINQAIKLQNENTSRIVKLNEESLAQARGDLEPFSESGKNAITSLENGLSGAQDLATNPNSQLSFIQDNPFFDALAKRSTDNLANKASSVGKLNSGGTREALQNSLVLLGSDLVNQNLSQRSNINNQYQGLVNTGLNASTNQALATQTASRDISNAIQGGTNKVSELFVDRGNAGASGVVGAANAETQGTQNAVNTGLTVASLILSDLRTKENIKRVGKMDNGLNLYKFNYKGSSEAHINVMAQEVELSKPNAVKEINGLKYVDMELICQ